MTRKVTRRRVTTWIALGILAAMMRPLSAEAEQRLYVLHVTTKDGLRYETLSAEGPFTHASTVGGVIYASRDYRMVWSPQVKVLVVDTWIERRVPLKGHWHTILREHGLLESGNYRLLQRRPELTAEEMRTPEATPATWQGAGEAETE